MRGQIQGEIARVWYSSDEGSFSSEKKSCAVITCICIVCNSDRVTRDDEQYISSNTIITNTTTHYDNALGTARAYQ